jgi:hypothetical protein
MDVERIIDEIEQLREMFEAPDIRPLSASDIAAAIEGTTKCSRTALGFGCGSDMASVADLRLPHSDQTDRTDSNLRRIHDPSMAMSAC